MATKRHRGKAWHYVIRRKSLLPRPIYLSFDTEAEGDAYVARLEALLDQGVVPPEFTRAGHVRTLAEAIEAYSADVSLSTSARPVLDTIAARWGDVVIAEMDHRWAESWIRGMKTQYKIAPGTIRKYKGAVSQVLDWLARTDPSALAVNPLHGLPAGYSRYSDRDAAEAGVRRSDASRDRRLTEDEEVEIRRILAGGKPDDRQRAFDLHWQGALETVFDLALETAMRLREIYSLRVDQIDVEQRTIHLTKTKNGQSREVPMSSVAVAVIERYLGWCRHGERGMSGFNPRGGDLLFPLWDGGEPLSAATSRLSRFYARAFAAAGADGLRFHDLRHEATCRIYLRTRLSDTQIARITGHKDPRMLARYASLRGSELAAELW